MHSKELANNVDLLKTAKGGKTSMRNTIKESRKKDTAGKKK